MSHEAESERFLSIPSPSWPGLDGIKHLFVFGDSYSSIGYSDELTIDAFPPPSVDNPLGIPFPGETWTDDDDGRGEVGLSRKPNWVGHLVESRRKNAHPIVVYDFACGGHTVSGVRRQIVDTFADYFASKPDWATWTPEGSLFVVWVGINDCAFDEEHQAVVKNLMDLIRILYDVGAINFLLIDVPPIDKSPAMSDSILAERPELAARYRDWNSQLYHQAKSFRTEYPDSTILVYSSYDLFMSVNEDPYKFGFVPGDLKHEGGAMWMDHLHPTSKMHKVIADDLEKFLKTFSKK